jgi:HSP20 family protein
MDPVKQLRSEIERRIARAWEGLTDGWREILSRGSGALTHYARTRKAEDSTGNDEHDFPQWGLLAGEAWETAQSVIVRVELPGMNKEDIDVSIHGTTLRIRGEKRTSNEQQGRLYHLMERAYGRFERTIPLPHAVDGARAEVSYRDGVITVILPKTEASPPRQLPIRDE